MKTIDEMTFTAAALRDGRFVGRCDSFPYIRSQPKTSRLDAIREVVDKTVQRIRDIDESRITEGTDTL